MPLRSDGAPARPGSRRPQRQRVAPKPRPAVYSSPAAILGGRGQRATERAARPAPKRRLPTELLRGLGPRGSRSDTRALMRLLSGHDIVGEPSLYARRGAPSGPAGPSGRSEADVTRRAQSQPTGLTRLLKAITPDPVERELVGQGHLAHGLHAAAKFVERGVRDYYAGGGGAESARTPGLQVRGRHGHLTVGRGAAVVDAGVVPDPVVNALKDLVELPAQAIPSVALPALAGIEWAQGDPRRKDALLKSYKDTGILPALVQGRPGEALKRAGKHPLYAALELSGGKALVGRGLGAAGRAGLAGRAGQRAASTAREPLYVYPKEVAGKEGPHVTHAYSRDLINKALQTYGERRREKVTGDRTVMTPKQRKKFHREQIAETQAVSVGRQQMARAQAFEASEKALGRPNAFNRVVRRQKRPGAHPGVDALVASGIAKSPETFLADTRAYRETIAQAERAAKAANENVAAREAKAARETLDDVLKSKVDVGAAFEGVQRYGREVATPQEAGLTERGIYGESQMGAKNVPAGVVHEGIQWDPARKGFDLGGEPITLEQVGKLLGEDPQRAIDPVFFSQRRASTGRGLFRGTERRPMVPGQPRTGAATRRGFDMPSDLLPREAAKRAVLLEADKGIERQFDELGIKIAVRDKQGNVTGHEYERSYARAQAVADELNEVYGLDLEPVNIDALRSAGQRLQKARERLDLNLGEEDLLKQIPDRIKAAFTEPPDGRGKFALISGQAKKLILEHNQPVGTGLKALQSITNIWKKVILATSKGWIPGNVIDLTLRAATEGLSPVAWKRGRRLMKVWNEIDPEGASIFEERALGGGVFRTSERTSPFRRAEQFEGSALEGTARALAKASHAPVARNVIGAFNEWAKAIFYGNGKIELNYRYAALGKHVKRRIGTILDDQAGWTHISDKALADYIEKGLTDTPHQTEAAKFIERVYGRWGKLSPDGRKFVATTGPFIQWLRVATKFVFVTLPAHHPIKTGILAAMSEMTENQRRQLGLTLFPDKGTPTAWEPLQGGIPTGDGRILAFASKSSFGITSEFPQSLASFINPQWHDAIMAFQGMDWTGKKLKDRDGLELNRGQRALVGLGLTIEGFAPGSYYVDRLLKGKPASKVFNPFFIGEAAGEDTGGKKSGWSTDGGSSKSGWSVHEPTGGSSGWTVGP